MIIDAGSDYEFLRWKGLPAFAMFDIDEYFSRLLVSVENPTDNEIENYRKDKIRFRATSIENVVWLTFKIGDLSIMDAPFSLHLTKSVYRKSFIESLKTLRITLIDSLTGKTAIQLQYSLSDEIINELSYLILSCYNMPFDEFAYFKLIDSIQHSMSPADIFEDSSVEYNSDEEKFTQLEFDFNDNQSLITHKENWYSALLTDEFVNYFSDENSIYFTVNSSGKIYNDTFKKFRDVVLYLTAFSQWENFEDSLYYHIKDKDEELFLYLSELAEPFFCDERRPDFKEVYHSIKGNMFECDIDELSVDQLAVGMMFPFWSRMGGSFEDKFAETGRLREFFIALYNKTKTNYKTMGESK